MAQSAAMMLALVGSVAALLVTWVLLWVRGRRKAHGFLRAAGIEGPPPDLLWGNWKQLKEDRIAVMEEWISKYGKVFGFYKGTVPHVVISDADLIKECFIKESAAFYDRPPAILPVKPYTDMLLFLRGADWKHVRTVLNPSFSAAKMKLMTPIISRCVEDFMSVMERKADNGEAINVMEAAQGLSLDVIANCALAWQLDSQKKPDNPLAQLLRGILYEAETAFTTAFVAFPILGQCVSWMYGATLHSKRSWEIIDNVRSVVEARRSLGDGVSNAGGGKTRRMDILQLLLDAQVYEELMRKYPSDEELDYGDLQELQRLDMFVKEALRLYPPVVLLVSRHCRTDTTILGQFFPAGCEILAPVWHVHHDAQHWPDPFCFSPERFAPEVSKDHHPGAYMPFGIGPKSCIGNRFALLELKAALCKLLRKFEVLPCARVKDPMELVVKTVLAVPATPIQVKLRYRKTALQVS
ncbi:cytochrome P450 3A14-like isoform X6 [Haemaphysalis longicornis]